MATISQRISLEGSEDISRKLEALGAAGAQAFKQIQDAAKKPISDPAQIDKTKQAMNELVAVSAKLGPQFQALANSTQQFGAAGAQATQQVATGLQQTSAAAQQANAAIAQAGASASVAGQTSGSGIISAANAWRLAAAGIVAAIAAVAAALTKGTVEAGTAIAEQANKLGLTARQYQSLQTAINAAGLSQDAFNSGVKSFADNMDKAQGATQRLSDTVTEQTVKTKDGLITITRFNDVQTKAKQKAETESEKAANALQKLGVSTRAIASGDNLAAMRKAAEAIIKIGDNAGRAEAGAKAFGDNWKEIVQILLATPEKKEFRFLTEDEINKTKKLAAAWRDLQAGINAIKNLIGTVFLDPALARADWLINITDGVTKLIRAFLQLDQAKRKVFLENLGEGPAATAFRFLLDLGRQLAGLWNDVLVPAGRSIAATFASIAQSIGGGTTGSQVAAFFITAAAAAVALATALKGIALVLSPIGALISFAFSPLGIILIGLAALVVAFWDKFKAAAQAALALIPQELQQMKAAFQALFQGDFTGFWNQFSAAAVSAFQKISAAAAQTDIGQALAAAIKAVVDALGGVETAAIGVAAALTLVFGRRVTTAGLGAVLAIAQMTGALDLLKNMVGIVGGTITTFMVSLGALVTIFGGIPIAIALVTTALAGLIIYLDPGVWNFYAQAATGAFNLIASAVGPVVEAINFLTGLVGGTGAGAWDIFRNAALAAINPIYGALRALLNIIELVKMGLATMRSASPPPTSSSGAPTGEPGPFARGGWVGGRGTGTSDSNLAWVSRGEHIMPARAVAQPGVLAFLEALRRSGGNLSRVLDGMGRFALGGMVPRAIPAFAAGGLAGGMSNVTIQFPGLPPVGGLRASSDVVDQLHRAAALAQVRSGGRKPSRYS